MKKFLLIYDGDKRLDYLKEYLSLESNFKIYTVNSIEDVHKYVREVDAVILPIVTLSLDGKVSNTNITLNNNFFGLLSDKTIFTGVTTELVRQHTKNYGINLIEIFANDEIAIKNAVATSEAVVGMLIEKLDTTIANTNILVFGYGKVGIVLCNMLKKLNAHITVVARSKKDLIFAIANDLKFINISEVFEKDLSNYSALINTIPYEKIVNEKIIKKLSKEIKIIDISSKPGGIDFNIAKQCKIDASLELALPKRYAPKTAAFILANEIMNQII